MKKKLRIGMFTHTYLPTVSGITVHIDRNKKELTKMGHRIFVITPRIPGSKRKRDVILLDSVNFRIKKKFWIGMPLLFDLKNKIEKLNLDVIHVHHPYIFGHIALFCSRLLNIPAVFTYHTKYEDYAHYFPMMAREFVSSTAKQSAINFCNRVDFVIAQTQFLKKYLIRNGVKARIEVIPSGIDKSEIRFSKADLKRKLDLSPKNIVLLCVTRLSKEKNLDFLIKSFYEISKKDDDICLIIVGDGPYFDDLIKIIEKYNISNKIRLVGFVNPKKIWDYYNIADLLVHTSRTETFGFIFVEAFFVGIPVVAVRGFANVDVVQDNFNGILTKNNIKDFSSSVLRVIHNNKLKRKLKDGARLTARKYYIENVSQRLVNLYKEAIKSHKNKI